MGSAASFTYTVSIRSACASAAKPSCILLTPLGHQPIRHTNLCPLHRPRPGRAGLGSEHQKPLCLEVSTQPVTRLNSTPSRLRGTRTLMRTLRVSLLLLAYLATRSASSRSLHGVTAQLSAQPIAA